MHDQRPTTPIAKAVNIARKMLTPKTQTPRFDPIIHRSPVTTPNPDREARDSFLGAIGSRTPLMATKAESENDSTEKDLVINTPGAPKEDSFSEHIVSRSPIRLTTQAADPKIEVDAMENALQKIVQEIPTMPDKPQLPVEVSLIGSSPLLPHEVISVPVVSEESEALSVQKPSASRVNKTSSVKTSVSVVHKKVSRRASLAKTPLAAQSRSSSRPEHRPFGRTSIKASVKMSGSGTVAVSSLEPAVVKVTPTRKNRPTTSKKSSPATAQTAVAKRDSSNITSNGGEQMKPESRKPRVSSLTTRPFIPTKSSKPPTRSTFALPGEAVAQKLKAAREERLKREEPDKTQVSVLKTRPVRKSVVPTMEVKTNAASRARLSVAGRATSGQGADGVPKGPVIRPLARISSTASTQTKVKAHTVLKSQHEASIAPPATTNTPPAKANTSATRAPSFTASKAPGRRVSTMSKATGKEVFARAKLEEEARLKEKKEKEEAAKKARVEAAERGRLASREWAEKMKVKKAGAAGSCKAEVGSRVGLGADSGVEGSGVGGESVIEGSASSA